MTDEALELAAQCWCDTETSGKEMDVELAKAFARRLDPLLQQIAECQAREKALREWFKTLLYNSPKNSYPSIVAEEALAMPHDSTDLDAMLKQAKWEALLEAANIVDINNMPLKSRELRRMAEELK